MLDPQGAPSRASEPLAKANARRQHAIDACGTTIGADIKDFRQTRHEIFRLTEDQARRQKDRRVVLNMLKNLVDHPSFRERSSPMHAQKLGQLLRCDRLAIRQRAGERSRLSSGESRQQLGSQGARSAHTFIVG